MLDFSSSVSANPWDTGASAPSSFDFSTVGPQNDGTYDVPAAATQTNDPSNTAGFAASADPGAYDILKFGLGAAADLYKFGKTLDYKRYESTQGGTFVQGQPSSAPRQSSGGTSSKFMLISLVAIAALVLLTHKA